MFDGRVVNRPGWVVAALVVPLLLAGCNHSAYVLRPHGDYHVLYKLTADAESAYGGEQWGLAQRYYAELSRLTPTDNLTWLRLGNSYARQGELTNSEEAFETAIRLQPDALKPRYNLATVQMLKAQSTLHEILQDLRLDASTTHQLEIKLRKLEALLDLSTSAGSP